MQVLALQEGHTPIKSGVVGGILVGIIGVLLPPTMFWVRSPISRTHHSIACVMALLVTAPRQAISINTPNSYRHT